MILHVTQAKYIEDYKLEVLFNNGHKGIADLAQVLEGPVFKPLQDKSFFAQLRVDKELETIVWPNGADFAPEFIYFQVFKNKHELQPQFKQWGYK